MADAKGPSTPSSSPGQLSLDELERLVRTQQCQIEGLQKGLMFMEESMLQLNRPKNGKNLSFAQRLRCRALSATAAGAAALLAFVVSITPNFEQSMSYIAIQGVGCVLTGMATYQFSANNCLKKEHPPSKWALGAVVCAALMFMSRPTGQNLLSGIGQNLLSGIAESRNTGEIYTKIGRYLPPFISSFLPSKEKLKPSTSGPQKPSTQDASSRSPDPASGLTEIGYKCTTIVAVMATSTDKEGQNKKIEPGALMEVTGHSILPAYEKSDKGYKGHNDVMFTEPDGGTYRGYILSRKIPKVCSK